MKQGAAAGPVSNSCSGSDKSGCSETSSGCCSINSSSSTASNCSSGGNSAFAFDASRAKSKDAGSSVFFYFNYCPPHDHNFSIKSILKSLFYMQLQDLPGL